jgi:hypothetical protein
VGARRVYVGSLQITPITGPNLSWSYIESMYSFLASPPYDIKEGALRWDGFSFNLHDNWSNESARLDDLLSNLRRVFATKGELNPNLVIGEWGFRADDVEYQKSGIPASLQGTFDVLRARFPVMYFLSHDRFSDAFPETYGLTRAIDNGSLIKPANVDNTDSPHYRLHNSPDGDEARTLWDVMKSLYSGAP